MSAECGRCGEAAEPARLVCDDCAAECYAHQPHAVERDDDDELGDVLAFLKQLEIDAERFGKPIALSEVAERLGRGEHRT